MGRNCEIGTIVVGDLATITFAFRPALSPRLNPVSMSLPSSRTRRGWRARGLLGRPSPSRRRWSPGISDPRWNMMLTRFFDGLKLAMLRLYAKVGVFHLTDSVTRPSAPRMMSRARRIVDSRGWLASSSHWSTSGFRFIRGRDLRPLRMP